MCLCERETKHKDAEGMESDWCGSIGRPAPTDRGAGRGWRKRGGYGLSSDRSVGGWKEAPPEKWEEAAGGA